MRLFAKLKRIRAKNDRIDARLIAAATVQVDAVRSAQDPRLAALAERLTAYEQIADALATTRRGAIPALPDNDTVERLIASADAAGREGTSGARDPGAAT